MKKGVGPEIMIVIGVIIALIAVILILKLNSRLSSSVESCGWVTETLKMLIYEPLNIQGGGC